ncbi:MAG: Crp/Fnr family transcriptional regulator [Sphingorhabdus sp.]
MNTHDGTAMLSQQAKKLLARSFPSEAGPDAADALVNNASLTQVPEGGILFASGDACENFVLVLSGSARVRLLLKTGREVTLYHLSAGQSCALTTSCLLTHSAYYAEGIAETDLEIVTVPAAEFRAALALSPKWAAMLLEDYSHRIGDLVGLVDRLTARNIDTDLAAFLEQNKQADGIVALSHRAIAEELGTAREVISRKLKKLEQAGIVTLGRNQIKILD